MSTTPGSGTPGQQAKHEFERAKAEASELASTAADVARQRGREGADRVKATAAEQAEQLADAIDATADDLGSGDGTAALSSYGHNMASMMRRFAGGLRERDIEELAGQLATFARRNPGSFLAGSVALGFGLSRFLKATSYRPQSEYRSGSYEDEDEEIEYAFEPEDELEYEEMEIDTTLEPAPSPEVSSYAAGERWPADEGRERPGAASPTRHTTAAVSEPQGSESSSRSASGPASSPAGSTMSSDTESTSGSSNERIDVTVTTRREQGGSQSE